MRVKDYEYQPYDPDLEDELLNDERKEELIEKIKKQIKRDHIPLSLILRIGNNDAELNFIFRWMERNNITMAGKNGSISGEKDNYRRSDRMGKISIPDPLEEDEEKSLFVKMNELRETEQGRNSEEYLRIRNRLVENNIRLTKWIVFSQPMRGLRV